MGKIIPIKYLEEILSGEEEKTVFYPRTHLRAVIDSNGKTLEDILNELLNVAYPITLSVSLHANKTLFDENEEKKGTLEVGVLIKKGAETLPLTEVDSIKLSVTTSVGLTLNTDSPELNESGTGYKPINFSFDDSGKEGYSSSIITLSVTLKNGKSASSSVNIRELAWSYVGFIYLRDINDVNKILQDIERAIKYNWDDDKLDNITGDKIIASSERYPNIISKQNTSLVGTEYTFKDIKGSGSNTMGFCFFTLIPKNSNFKKDLEVKVSNTPWAGQVRDDLNLYINGVSYEVRHTKETNRGTGTFKVSI